VSAEVQWFYLDKVCLLWKPSQRGYIIYAANEAEKASNITLVEARAVGAYGRLIMVGKEADVLEASRAATEALKRI